MQMLQLFCIFCWFIWHHARLWSKLLPSRTCAETDMQVSPDHSRLAYAVDTVGGEKFTLHVVDLATGKQVLTPPIDVRSHDCFVL
jgi:Prolyl oligopeptidase, N-terminal beta-propeller domain